ncbi:DUF5937 family protein [Streptosporangium sp. NPDC000396]|uniref:DUF5937 family protein n=1 Tax=Streptosporangium sp. NPDC000396 TaxID=3366185 RepID=UPI00367A9755
MSFTIDGVMDDRVTFGPSPLGELAAMLHVLAEPAHHPALHSWVVTTGASLPADLADRIHAADFLWQVGRSDFLVPYLVRESLREDLDDLDALDDDRFLSAALVPACGTRRVVDDATQIREARDRAEARGPRQAAFVEWLFRDLAGLRHWLRRLLEDCHDAFFADAWRRVQVSLAADARHKADLARRRSLAEAVSAISPALSLQAGRLTIDKVADAHLSSAHDGITFSPTSFGWPHLVVVHKEGWRPVVQYPLPAHPLPGPVPFDTVRRRLEALSHPVRMRLCRSLARGPHTTGELALIWQITAPEVSRHLAVLRRVGLLSTRRRGRYTEHHLDLSATARLGTDYVEAVLR